jgi:hypothetical protein
MRVLLLTLLLSSCAGATTIPDFRAHITLPASGDGYFVKTVSHDEGRIPKALWSEQSKHGIVLLSEDWAILRKFLLENCLMNKCKLAVGTFDDLFFAIDSALKKMPIPKP